MHESEHTNEKIQLVYERDKTDPSLAIITAIAEAEGVQATNIGQEPGIQLGDHVNLDAIDDLVTAEDEVTVSFSVKGYLIQVDAEEVIVESHTSE